MIERLKFLQFFPKFHYFLQCFTSHLFCDNCSFRTSLIFFASSSSTFNKIQSALGSLTFFSYCISNCFCFLFFSLSLSIYSNALINSPSISTIASSSFIPLRSYQLQHRHHSSSRSSMAISIKSFNLSSQDDSLFVTSEGSTSFAHKLFFL